MAFSGASIDCRDGKLIAQASYVKEGSIKKAHLTMCFFIRWAEALERLPDRIAPCAGGLGRNTEQCCVTV